MSASLPPSGHRSPASAGRRSPAPAACRSPAPPRSSNRAEADLLRLHNLDNREEQESDDDYSLLNAPSASAVSSLGRSTRSASAHTASPSEGTSPVSVSATPVHMGGRTRSGREGGVGGVGGVGLCSAPRRSAKASSVSPAKAESPSKAFATKNADTPQLCIFLEKADGKTLCLGKVGSSKHFCLAPKEPGYSHCGVAAHGRGLYVTTKFTPKFNAFYVPVGIMSGHPTAMMAPFVLQENVPRHMLSKFENAFLTADKWTNMIQAAVLYDNVVEDMEDEAGGEDDGLLGQQEEEESSTIGCVMEEDEEDKVFEFNWESPLDDLDTDWAPTTSAHCKALELLARLLTSTTKSTSVGMRSIEKMIKRIGGETDKVKRQLGNLHKLVQGHESLVDTVQATLTAGVFVQNDLSDL
jgi:hypothetical protein